MEFSASGIAAIPIILFGVGIPLFMFVILPILIIRSVFKGLKRNLPAGTGLSQIRSLINQVPKGVNWQKIRQEWDIKSELPKIMKQMSMSTKDIPTTLKSGKIESKEPPSPKPSSASSRITSVKTTHSGQMQSPKSYEIIQTIKRVAIVVLLLGLFYAVKDFFV